MFFLSCFLLCVWRTQQTVCCHGNWVEGHSEGLHGCAGSNCTDSTQGMELWRTQVEVRKLQAESTPISCCFSTASAPSASALTHRQDLTGNPDGLITKMGSLKHRFFPSVFFQNHCFPFIPTLTATIFSRLKIKGKKCCSGDGSAFIEVAVNGACLWSFIIPLTV